MTEVSAHVKGTIWQSVALLLEDLIMMKIVLASKVVLTAALLVACSVTVADEKPEDSGTLTIGSKAPALDIEHWVSDGNGQFQPVTEFEDGKIYVVEFWATWCGPCISSMPHLVELQNAHAKDGVQVVSISDEDMETVNKFLERKYAPRGKASEDEDQPSTYGELTSAYCLTTDPDESCNQAYMKAAGQNGIPCCFLVGKTGHVEWIGHPMSLDKTLEAVIADKWDRTEFAKEFVASQKVDLAVAKAGGMLQEGDFDGALAMFEALRKENPGEAGAQIDFYISRIKEIQLRAMVSEGKVDEVITMLDEKLAAAEEADKTAIHQQKFSVLLMAEKEKEAAVVLELLSTKLPAAELNQISWSIYETAAQEDGEVAAELVQAATAAAKKAVQAEPKNAAILDTLAHLIYLSGDLQEAIKIQTKAVELQDPPSDDISAFLKQMEMEAAKKNGEDEK